MAVSAPGPRPPDPRACAPGLRIIPPLLPDSVSLSAGQWFDFAATFAIRCARGTLFQERTELSQAVEVLNT